MNLQRREEIRIIAECPNDMHWAQEMRRAVAELLAHISTLEQTAAERVITDGSSGPGVVPAAVVPDKAAWLTIDEIAAVIEEGAADYKMTTLLRSQALHIARLIACASMDKGARAIPADRVLGDTLESMRSRLCAALGLPADSAPETVTEALNHTALVGRGELSILRDFAARRMGPRESDRLEMTQDGYAETLRAIRANQGGISK